MLLRYGWAPDKSGPAFVEREISLSSDHARLIIGRNGTGKSLAGKVVEAVSRALHASESEFKSVNSDLLSLGLAWFEVEWSLQLYDGRWDDPGLYEDVETAPFPPEGSWSDVFLTDEKKAVLPKVSWEKSRLQPHPLNDDVHLMQNKLEVDIRLRINLREGQWLCAVSSNLNYTGISIGLDVPTSMGDDYWDEGEHEPRKGVEVVSTDFSLRKIVEVPSFRYSPILVERVQPRSSVPIVRRLSGVLAEHLREPLRNGYLDLMLKELFRHHGVDEGSVTRQDLLMDGADVQDWTPPKPLDEALTTSLSDALPRYRGLDAFRIRPAQLTQWRKDMLKELIEAHRDIYRATGVSPRIDSIDDHMEDASDLLTWIDRQAESKTSSQSFLLANPELRYWWAEFENFEFPDQDARIKQHQSVRRFFTRFKFFGLIPIDFDSLKKKIDGELREDATPLEKATHRWKRIRPTMEALRGIFDKSPLGLKRGRDTHQLIMGQLEAYWNTPLLRDIMPWSDLSNEVVRKRMLVFQTLRYYAFLHDTVTTGLYESFKWLFLHEEDFGSQPLPGLTGGPEPQYVNDQFDGFLDALGDPKTMPSGYHHILCVIMSMLRAPKGLSDDEKEILFIDEPEISLHVDWQERLVSLMEELNSEYREKRVKLMIATHSPEIIMNHMDQVIDFTLNLEV